MNYTCLIFIFVFVFITCNDESEFFVPQFGKLYKNDQKGSKTMPKMVFVKQKLDHFNTSNNETWIMRVQYNDEFFKPSSPIFVMIGGENPFSSSWLEYGQMYDMAKDNNAFMFYTEHRFYGWSIPNKSLTLDNLKYLTPDQALADIIHMIRWYKEANCSLHKSKVVVFGGSYAGNLALWIRSKYPNDIHAAVSSSAPLLAKFDFEEYNEVVQSGLGEDCSKIISKGLNQILHTLGTPDGAIKIQKDFNMCDPIDANDTMEITYLLSIVTTYFGGLVQNFKPSVVKESCIQLIFPDSEDEYSRLTSFLSDVLGSRCKKGYKDFKNYISSTNAGNLRQWMYQSCSQFGFFQTTTSKKQLFGKVLPIEMYQTWCKDFFGPEFEPIRSKIGISRTNLIYGGLNPEVTRVVSIHGTADPWHKLGLSKDLNSEAPVIIVNGTYHCEDLNSVSNTDSEEMINAKLKVQNYVKKWLKQN